MTPGPWEGPRALSPSHLDLWAPSRVDNNTQETRAP